MSHWTDFSESKIGFQINFYFMFNHELKANLCIAQII